jgi:primase-polymerase (primpol)-like protein
MQKYGFLGVGFMFTLESGIVGIDLDKCFDEHGNLNAIAKAILDRVGATTYTELSPSRTGLHIFL